MRTRFAISAAVVASMTVGLAAAAALPGPAARADQVFHTARFPLHPVGSEPLRSGFVEDAHANGPTIVAHEEYVLNGAQPATAYQVTLNIFVRDPTCAGSAGVVFPTAVITTDAAGDGSGDAFFLPSGVPAVLRNATHGFIYTLSDSSGVRYSSGCVVVTLRLTRGTGQQMASQSSGGAMIILRFKIRSNPGKSEELMAALAEIITPARATEGVINFDIARVLLDPDAFIATAVYEDGAALERQESLPEVDRVMAMLPESLVAPPERTIFDASVSPTLV